MTMPEPYNYRPPPTSWTEDRERMLKALVLLKLSAKQIAKRLGGVTRNAVIGKVARMGLRLPHRISQSRADVALRARGRRVPGSDIKPRMGGIRKMDRQERETEAKKLVEYFACTEIVDLTPEQSATFCTIMQLTEHTCRWPIGTPNTPDFGYCGAWSDKDRAYCDRHWFIAHHQPGRAGS